MIRSSAASRGRDETSARARAALYIKGPTNRGRVKSKTPEGVFAGFQQGSPVFAGFMFVLFIGFHRCSPVLLIPLFAPGSCALVRWAPVRVSSYTGVCCPLPSDVRVLQAERTVVIMLRR